MNIVYALPNWVNYVLNKGVTSICDGNFDPATVYVNGKGACVIVYCQKNQGSSIKLQDSSDQGLKQQTGMLHCFTQ